MTIKLAQCGHCRKSTVRGKGHRPSCQFYDQHAANGRRRRREFLRKCQEADTSPRYARGVILSL